MCNTGVPVSISRTTDRLSSRSRYSVVLSSVLAVLFFLRGAKSDDDASLRERPKDRSSKMPKHIFASKSDPTPASFPERFQIDFMTNVTWQEYTGSDVTSSILPNATLIPGRLYYDWTKKMQRIDHGSGSYECFHFYNHEGPCSLVFIPDWGMYRILRPTKEVQKTQSTRESAFSRQSSQESLSCCLDIANLGTPPPDWAERGSPTYNGVVQDSFSNQSAHEWVFDHVFEETDGSYTSRFPWLVPFTRPNDGLVKVATPAERFHTTRQVAKGDYQARPLLFTFPSAGGTQDYHYLVDTLKEVEEMDASVFILPDGCQTQFCQCCNDPLSSQA